MRYYTGFTNNQSLLLLLGIVTTNIDLFSGFAWRKHTQHNKTINECRVEVILFNCPLGIIKMIIKMMRVVKSTFYHHKMWCFTVWKKWEQFLSLHLAAISTNNLNHNHYCEVRLNLSDFCLVFCKLLKSGIQFFFLFAGLSEKRQNDESFSVEPGTLPVAGLWWSQNNPRRDTYRRFTSGRCTSGDCWCWNHKGELCWGWRHCHHNQPKNPVWWNGSCWWRWNNNTSSSNNNIIINNTHNNNINIGNNNSTSSNRSLLHSFSLGNKSKWTWLQFCTKGHAKAWCSVLYFSCSVLEVGSHMGTSVFENFTPM